MSPSAVTSPPPPEPAAPLLSLSGISKSFSGVEVLRDVAFDLHPGEVHVLAGENGAGKSTLIKIAAGVHTEYEGSIDLYGRPTRFASPHDAAQQGISVIHQEMSLIDAMSVVDNMFLGRELTRRGSGTQWLDRAAQLRRAREFCGQLDLGDLDLERPVEDYSLSVKNRIEIAKALAWSARIFVMDEPTSALSRAGGGPVLRAHRPAQGPRLRHHLHLAPDGGDLSPGRPDHGAARRPLRSGPPSASALPQSQLIRWMIGRELTTHFPGRDTALGPERLRVEGLSVLAPGSTSTGSRRWLVRDVSLSVRAGEIVGIAGLQGSGNSELFRAIFGAYGELAGGRVLVDGQPFQVQSPRHSVQQGLAYLTSDRKGTGLVLSLDVARNVTLASIPAISPGGWIREARERRITEEHTEALRIRATGPTQEVSTLSGGNQQKVALAKWIETRPRVLLLDEPTRGVDVGAKHEIYELMNQWTRQGHAILLITSEMPELLGLSDRIIAMHRGRVTGQFTRSEATQEKVLQAAMADSAP